MIKEGEKKHYILINDFNRFMFDHSLHCGITHFVAIVYKLSLQEKYQSVILKTDCKKTIKIPKNGEYVTYKNFERKIKSRFMIYADFEIILLAEDNVKQNQNESFTSKYQKHVAYS